MKLAPALTPAPAATSPDSIRAERRRTIDQLTAPARRSVRFSGWIAFLLFALLIAGGTLAPIMSGVVSVGQLAVEGDRKLVQHASGGIVSEILVSEGDVVQAGDIVMRLNKVQAGAALGAVSAQIDNLRAEEAVRMAEVAGRKDVAFSQDLIAREQEPGVAAILNAQLGAFKARRDLAASEKRQLTEQLQQIAQSTASAEAEIRSTEEQIASLEVELQDLQTLLDKGLTQRPRVLAMERELSVARGRLQSLKADVSRLEAQAAETRTRRDQIDISRRAEASDELRTLRAEITELLDRQVAASDTFERTEVRAPTAGVVMALSVTTAGGVIEAGQPLMEIVPQSDALIVKARVAPKDADNVYAGLPAIVRFDISGGRAAPRVRGRVTTVSADALTDRRTGEAYFEARIAIPADEAEKVPDELIAPGLPAEILIETGSQTALDYLLAPIERTTFRAMRDK